MADPALTPPTTTVADNAPPSITPPAPSAPIVPATQNVPPAHSPFDQTGGSPFGEVAQYHTPPASTVPTPGRTATLAMALLEKQHDLEMDQLSSTLSSNMDIARQLISSGQEYNQQLQAVLQGTQDRLAGLNKQVNTELPGTDTMFTPDLVNSFKDTMATDRAQNMDTLAHSALEESAMRVIQDKLAGGDPIEAKAIANQFDPTKATTAGVMRDFYLREMVINNALERSGMDAEQVPFWHKVLTTVASIPESFLLSGARDQIGDYGNNQNGIWSYLFPTNELAKEVQAWHNLSGEQQAAALPQLIQNIQANTTHLGLSDPGRAAEILSDFKGEVDNWAKIKGTAMNALDLAMILPMFKGVGAISRVPEIMTGLGARNAARDTVATAWYNAIEGDGLANVGTRTAIVPDTILEKGLPTPVNPLLVPEAAPSVTKGSLLSGTATVAPELVNKVPEFVPMAGDIAQRMSYVREALNSPEIAAINGTARLSPEEKQVAIAAELDRIKGLTSNNVLDYTPTDVRLSNGQTITRMDMTINKPFTSEEDAMAYLHDVGFAADPSNVIFKEGAQEDTSGQFFPRISTYLRETGFYTGDLNVPKQNFLARWFSSPYETSDFNVAAKGTASGYAANAWRKATSDLNKAVTKLGPNDRTFLREIIQKGSNEQRWLSPSEFDLLWERSTGKTAPDTAKAAYSNYITANDVDYEMRNANALADYAQRGVQSVKFDADTKTIDGLGIVDHDMHLPNDRMYDTNTGVHFNPGDLTEADMERMKGEGYVRVTPEEAVTLPDGTRVREFLVKKGDLEMDRLPDYVLPYSEGGHRVYTDKYFAKQAATFTQPDTGEQWLDKPNVFVTGTTKAEVDKWTRKMEAARLALRDGASKDDLDSIFSNERGLPTGQQFVDGVNSKKWNLDHPFETVFDREMPSAYGEMSSAGKFQESGANAYYRTRGQLYYSSKGDPLKNIQGDLAPTMDPFKMMNQSLYNVARLSSFDDFKTSSINRWIETYRSNLSFDPNASPSEIFNTAETNRGVNADLKHQIDGQREAIKRILNFRTNYDMNVENSLRHLSEAIVGDGDSALRNELGKMPLNWMDRSPVQSLRGAAFDLKLGMFNPGRYLIHSSIMASALAMSPKAGLKGMFTIPAMIAWRLASHSENSLDLLAKRGFADWAGFGSEGEFKDYMRFVARSGLLDSANSNILINTAHPAAAYAITDKWEAFKVMSRFFFDEADRNNKLVGARIAYDEAVAKFGKPDWSNPAFREFMQARTENYSFNMSSTSAAMWQKGLLSIPTQFWSYNWRIMEGLMGKQFTAAQKARLLGAQIFMGGIAGIPLVGIAQDVMNQKYGYAPRMTAHADDPRGPVSGGEQTLATIQRGLVDELIAQTTGADVQVGSRLSSGDFFTKTVENMFGFGEGADKTTPADMMGGATYSIFGEAIGSALAVVHHWVAAQTGGVDPSEMTQNDWETLIRQVSSLNQAYKAYFAFKYGTYQSAAGHTIVTNMPSADSAWLAMGFQPGEMRDISAMAGWQQDRKEMVQQAASFINERWGDALREPDTYNQNARIVSQFINMLPPGERLEVLRKANGEKSPSEFDNLLKSRYQKDSTDAALEALATVPPQPDSVPLNATNDEVNQQ